MPSNVDAILSVIGEIRHALHLYSSDIDKYVVHASFLATAKEGSAVCVTNEDPKTVKREFEGFNVKPVIIRPEELGKLLTGDRVLRVVVDASSIDSSKLERMEGRMQATIGKYIDHLQREKYLAESCRSNTILCTYDVSKLTPELVRQLVTFHDRLMLTTSDTTLLAADALDRTGTLQETIQRFVKDELESIVLALLLRESLCGIDIIKNIYNQFGVLLSPGTIYPLLHNLEKRRLLKCECGAKTRTYKPAEAAEEEIRKILGDHARARRFLSGFLGMASASERALKVRASKKGLNPK